MHRILALALLLAPCAFAQDVEELKFELFELRKRVAELDKKVEHLDSHFHKDEGDHGSDTHFKLLDLSLNIRTAAGTSTSTNDELAGLQAGGHDPRRRGFSLQQAEFAFAGALVPWFAGEAYLIATEETIELEEAFLRSLCIPFGFELKAGYFLTEFGRRNKVHPHDWLWADQPVVLSRILGGEGQRGLGGRVAYHAPLPFDLMFLFGVQNADDHTAVSFLGESSHGHGHDDEEEEHEETIGGLHPTHRDFHTLGDLLYHTRLAFGFDIGMTRLEFGGSGAYGPNASGPTGKTWLAGADLLLGWSDGDCFVKLESELLYRYYQANRQVIENDPSDPLDDEVFDATVFGDWGFYAELTGSAGLNLIFGLRIEYASGFRAGLEERREDPFRDNRLRLSPLVAWAPIEELRLSLQYNLDYTQHIGGRSSHSAWLSLSILFGVHKHIH